MARAVAVAVLPSLSAAVAVTVFEWSGPLKSPLTVSVNEQVKKPQPTIEPPVAHVPWPSRSPKSVSVRSVRVTGSAVSVGDREGERRPSRRSPATEVGSAVLVTVIEGSTSLKSTVAVADSVSPLPSSSLPTGGGGVLVVGAAEVAADDPGERAGVGRAGGDRAAGGAGALAVEVAVVGVGQAVEGDRLGAVVGDRTVNSTAPPVSGTEVGLAVLVTLMSGSTSLKVTVAVAVSVSLLAVVVGGRSR